LARLAVLSAQLSGPVPPTTRMLLRAEQWNVQPDCAVSLGRNRCPCFFSMRRAALVWHTGVGHLLGVDLPDNLGFVSDSLCERPSQRKQRCAEPVRHGPEDSSAQPCNVLRKHGAQDVSPGTRLRTLQTPVCSITGRPQLRGESKFFLWQSAGRGGCRDRHT
jgi:hypothetical protein